MEIKDIKERWSYIDGYNKDYIVTETGHIYTNKKELREMAQRGFHNPKRYLSVNLSINNVQTTYQVHRIVGICFVDGYFEGAVINHKDKNIHNNDYKNLEWCTQKQNIWFSYDVMDQVRNYKWWKIIYPNGKESCPLKGYGQIDRYIKNNNLPCFASSISKYKSSRGYKLMEISA